MITFITSYGAKLTINNTAVSITTGTRSVNGRWENGRVYADSNEELDILMTAIKEFLASREDDRYPNVETTWEDKQAYYLVMF